MSAARFTGGKAALAAGLGQAELLPTASWTLGGAEIRGGGPCWGLAKARPAGSNQDPLEGHHLGQARSPPMRHAWAAWPLSEARCPLDSNSKGGPSWLSPLYGTCRTPLFGQGGGLSINKIGLTAGAFLTLVGWMAALAGDQAKQLANRATLRPHAPARSASPPGRSTNLPRAYRGCHPRG